MANLVLLDAFGRVRKYEHVSEILAEFCEVRLYNFTKPDEICERGGGEKFRNFKILGIPIFDLDASSFEFRRRLELLDFRFMKSVTIKNGSSEKHLYKLKEKIYFQSYILN